MLQNEFALIPEYILVSPTFVMSGLYLCVGFFSAFISQFESWESPVAKNFAFIARWVTHKYDKLSLISKSDNDGLFLAGLGYITL